MKNKFVLLRMNEEDVSVLRNRSIAEHVSVSHLIREAVCKKYKLKSDKVKKYIYKSDKRPGRPNNNNSWSEKEIIILAKHYEPAKRGSKKNVAEKLNRSVYAVKHKIQSLQLNRL